MGSRVCVSCTDGVSVSRCVSPRNMKLCHLRSRPVSPRKRLFTSTISTSVNRRTDPSRGRRGMGRVNPGGPSLSDFFSVIGVRWGVGEGVGSFRVSFVCSEKLFVNRI